MSKVEVYVCPVCRKKFKARKRPWCMCWPGGTLCQTLRGERWIKQLLGTWKNKS